MTSQKTSIKRHNTRWLKWRLKDQLLPEHVGNMRTFVNDLVRLMVLKVWIANILYVHALRSILSGLGLKLERAQALKLQLASSLFLLEAPRREIFRDRRLPKFFLLEVVDRKLSISRMSMRSFPECSDFLSTSGAFTQWRPAVRHGYPEVRRSRQR
ncbi:hypothetical protein BKA93DRAFT_310954 [Sparassis latifolia]